MKRGRKRLELTGQTFDHNRFTVLEFSGMHNHQSTWKVRCQCGTVKVMKAGILRSGSIQSCGCLKTEVNSHPHRDQKVYDRILKWRQQGRAIRWIASKMGVTYQRIQQKTSLMGDPHLLEIQESKRVRTENQLLYAWWVKLRRRYGVCREWDVSSMFFDWISPKIPLDIKWVIVTKHKGICSPENCQFVEFEYRNKPLEAFGESKGITQWARDPRCVVKSITLQKRFYSGRWSLEMAITTPARAYGRTAKQKIAELHGKQS